MSFSELIRFRIWLREQNLQAFKLFVVLDKLYGCPIPIVIIDKERTSLEWYYPQDRYIQLELHSSKEFSWYYSDKLMCESYYCEYDSLDKLLNDLSFQLKFDKLKERI